MVIFAKKGYGHIREKLIQKLSIQGLWFVYNVYIPAISQYPIRQDWIGFAVVMSRFPDGLDAGEVSKFELESSFGEFHDMRVCIAKRRQSHFPLQVYYLRAAFGCKLTICQRAQELDQPSLDEDGIHTFEVAAIAGHTEDVGISEDTAHW